MYILVIAYLLRHGYSADYDLKCVKNIPDLEKYAFLNLPFLTLLHFHNN